MKADLNPDETKVMGDGDKSSSVGPGTKPIVAVPSKLVHRPIFETIIDWMNARTKRKEMFQWTSE